MAAMSKVKQYTFFIAGTIIMMATILNAYGVATVTPALLRKFGAMQHYALTSIISTVGMLLFLPIVGKLIDTVGRRPILSIGAAIYLVFSITSGFATNFVTFLVMRIMVSVGGAFLTPVPGSTLPFVFERSKLPQLYGIQGAFLALGTFFGSTIAGFFGDKGVAWIALAYPGVLAAIGAMVMFALCPEIPHKPMPSIDFGGIGLLFCFVAPLMYVASFGASMGWGNPLIIGALVILVIAFVGFINVEKRAKSPLVDLALFKNPTYTGALLCTFLLVWYQSSMRVYVPLVIQNVMGMSAAISGSVLLPRSILNIVFPTLCGAWISKNQKARCWQGIVIAGVLVAVGNLMLSFISPTTTLMVFFVGLGLTGIAESFKQSALMPALQSTLTAENMGSGMSLNSTMGTIGSTISACVFGIIYNGLAPDPTVLSDLSNASNMIFIVSAASGLAVCLLGVFLLRPKAAKNSKEPVAQ